MRLKNILASVAALGTATALTVSAISSAPAPAANAPCEPVAADAMKQFDKNNKLSEIDAYSDTGVSVVIVVGQRNTFQKDAKGKDIKELESAEKYTVTLDDLRQKMLDAGAHSVKPSYMYTVAEPTYAYFKVNGHKSGNYPMDKLDRLVKDAMTEYNKYMGHCAKPAAHTPEIK